MNELTRLSKKAVLELITMTGSNILARQECVLETYLQLVYGMGKNGDDITSIKGPIKEPLPALRPGELIFHFCIICGMDYLTRNTSGPDIRTIRGLLFSQLKDGDACDEYGNKRYVVLGTNQGAVWRNQNFPDGDFKFQTIRPKNK